MQVFTLTTPSYSNLDIDYTIGRQWNAMGEGASNLMLPTIAV